MAIARLIAPYDEFRGRDTRRGINGGNVVYSQGNQRNTRPFSRPFDPRSTLQASQRSAFSVASIVWASLSGSDVASWDALAATITRYNSVGMAYHPAARTLFMQSTLIWIALGAGPITTASLTQTYPIPSALTSVIHETGAARAVLAFGYADTAGIIQVRITDPLTPGTRSTRALQFKSPGLDVSGFPRPELSIADTTGGSSGPQHFDDLLFANPLVPGNRYGFRIQPLSAENALPGTPTDYIFDVTSAP